MAARTTREAARARVLATLMKALDEVIPEDEAKPLRGRTFSEWEDQADAFDQAVTSTLLEERAALEDSAQVGADQLGRCPHCGSDRLYLRREQGNESRRTEHGEVVLMHQRVRCRSCGRTFSPSGA
jgi:DNA-directed RNA polymerase subunit RPC12/RpoP